MSKGAKIGCGAAVVIGIIVIVLFSFFKNTYNQPVSYTHLTLPTN